MPRRGAPVHDLIAWLDGALRTGDLEGLPAYRDEGTRDPIPAETFGRQMIKALNDGPSGAPSGLLEGRAFRFRVWAERESAVAPIRPRPRIRRPRPEDPSHRGLDIGRSLRAISKNIACGPKAEVDDAPVVPEESPTARFSRRALIALFAIPFLGAAAVAVLPHARPALPWAGLVLGSLVVLLGLARAVPAWLVRPETPGATGYDQRERATGPGVMGDRWLDR